MDDKHIEKITQEICETFQVYAPPIPIEIMLQQPPTGMWKELDITQLSGNFMRVTDRYSPRMSLARMLARHIVSSDWGRERGLQGTINDPEKLNKFARMLVMPEEMIMGLTRSSRNPKTMSLHFEVPEDEARQRLLELV